MNKRNYSRSAALLERARKVMAGGVSSEFRKYNYPHALFYTHGKGSRVYDVDENEYLDFTLSQGPLILGHSHPAVLSAVNSYSEQGQLFAGQHLREIELAEKLQQLIPSAEKLRFCLDGSAAVQTAFRIARAKTGKKKFLRFEGHYHGWFDNVSFGLSAPSPEALGSREEPVCFPWSGGLPEHSADEFIILPWNDLPLLEQTLEKRAGEIAAIITEPIMCNNGCILPVDGFLEGIRRLCDAYNIAFILDEVITGFRMGLSGAQSYYNVVPDLSIFAKALASGYPISVIAGKQEWFSVVEDARVIHAGTMNSSNATVAAALATIQTLEEMQPYERMFGLGHHLMEEIRNGAAETGQNLLVQGAGPMFHTGFTSLKKVNDYRDTLHYDKAKLARFTAALHDRGIRIIGRGLWYISAVHTKEEIEHAAAIVKEVLKEMSEN